MLTVLIGPDQVGMVKESSLPSCVTSCGTGAAGLPWRRIGIGFALVVALLVTVAPLRRAAGPRHEPGHLVVGVADHAVRPRLRQPQTTPAPAADGSPQPAALSGFNERPPPAHRAPCAIPEHDVERPRPRRRGRRVLPPQRDEPAVQPRPRGQQPPGAATHGAGTHHPASPPQLNYTVEVSVSSFLQLPEVFYASALEERYSKDDLLAALPQPGLLRRGRLRHLLRRPHSYFGARPGPAHPGAGRHAGRQDPGPQPARPPFEARRAVLGQARSGPAGNGSSTAG